MTRMNRGMSYGVCGCSLMWLGLGSGVRSCIVRLGESVIGNTHELGNVLRKLIGLAFFSLMLLSGCATKTVYFKDEVEKSVNSERYKVMAPGIYAATKQNFLWFSDAATSDSEFGALFFLWIPFNIVDVPISLVSDSFALAIPKTWINQNRKESKGGWGPYITYVNPNYEPRFESLTEFKEFISSVNDTTGKGGVGGAAELLLHGFECVDCSDHSEAKFIRKVGHGSCSQEQTVYVSKQYYSGFEYDISMNETCQDG